MSVCKQLAASLQRSIPEMFNCFPGDVYTTIYTPFWYEGSEPIKLFVRALEDKINHFRVTDRGETTRWLRNLTGEDIFGNYRYEIEMISNVYGVRISDSHIIYDDVPADDLAEAVYRVSQAAKDAFAYRNAASDVAFTKDFFVGQILRDFERFFPGTVWHDFKISLKDEDLNVVTKDYTIDIYIPETKTVIQPIRVNNPKRLIDTAWAYAQLKQENPDIKNRVTIFDQKPPVSFKGIIKEVATKVIYRGTLESPEEYRVYRNQVGRYFESA